MPQITRRCCYCVPRHIIGTDNGSPYSDGLCWKAGLREDVKWYAPIVGRIVCENALVILAVGYLAAQLVRWGLNGFRILG